MHHVTGRLRVKCPALKQNASAAADVVRALKALRGVERCSVNPVTGSVLCHYDHSVTSAEPVIEHLRGLLPAPQAAARPEPSLDFSVPYSNGLAPPRQFGQRLGERVLSYLLEHAMERALVLLVRAII